jgi:aminocarboxymuconate-semialdehyde decarboxylase
MKSVDVHTHVLPPELPRWSERFGYGGFVRLVHEGEGACKARMVRDDGTQFREVESNCWDPAVRLRECDAAGVGVQVLSTVPVMLSYWIRDPRHALEVSRFLNDHIASLCAAQPRRFVGLGTLPMQAPDLAAHELHRCIDDLGLAGVEIGTHVGEWNLDRSELFPVFAEAEDLGAAVFVHPWDMMGQDQMPKYWLPWLVGMPAELSRAICTMIFGGVLERLPALRVCFAHGGGAFPITLGRIQRGFECRPDVVAADNPHPPTKYLGRFWVDSLVHDARALRYVIDTFGSHRVALGTDYPFPLGEERPGHLVRSLELDAKTREGLLTRNALEWLSRDATELDLA